MPDQEQSSHSTQQEAPEGAEHLNIKVTDGNNEVFFKIKKSTKLNKLMRAFCERQGKDMQTVRFLFDGARVREEDTPNNVRHNAMFVPISTYQYLCLDRLAHFCYLARDE
jgi:hypothetical protein